METVDPPVHSSEANNVKIPKNSDESVVAISEENENYKSNGDVKSGNVDQDILKTSVNDCEFTEIIVTDKDDNCTHASEESAKGTTEQVTSLSDTQFTTIIETEIVETTIVENDVGCSESSVITEGAKFTEEVVEVTENMCKDLHIAESRLELVNSELSNDVTFKTEILVEKNDNDFQSSDDNIKSDSHDSTNNILSELGHSIELSEVLNSDIGEHTENNNGSMRQEVFNKEELLDILEGNVKEVSEPEVAGNIEVDQDAIKSLETQLALQQLSRLSRGRRVGGRSNKSSEKQPRRSKKKSESNSNDSKDKKVANEDKHVEHTTEKLTEDKSGSKIENKVDILKESRKDNNIVNVLVKDWEDEETGEDQPKKELVENHSSLKTSEHIKTQENITNKEEQLAQTSEDSSLSHVNEAQTQSLTKTADEAQPHPQRRLGRVIKKKVIFDPDNPDTFTKGKTPTKNKESHLDKEQPQLSKKGKTDQIPLRSQSKSPTTKLQWKKPTPKNSKQNKRLTEIDKLLMDEGAVNMIYQLTPEAPKGKKNMRTKAEFIKKIQSSTPDSKEMKFRERKKEKNEEGEAKKIISGKHRTSLSSSVKSLSICEDFETHSADDSIIYRRHSSSSYSSSCMSPRRLSDVDTSATQAVSLASQSSDRHGQNKVEVEIDGQVVDVFTLDNSNTPGGEVINKNDCLTIKRKLNSKLSSVLNKRKHDSKKNEAKPSKQRKIVKENMKNEDVDNSKFLSINFDHNLAEICIRKTGSKYSIETLKELEKALGYVDSRKDISVTLLMSECGTLCSDLELKSLLHDNVERRTTHAFEIAETARSLLCTVEQHSKLLCCGIWESCWGVSLPLMALSDVVIASEHATFALKAGRVAPPLPGLAVFTAHLRPISQQVMNDLVVFGRKLSASEALQGGLVNRVLWPSRFTEQFRAVIKDIAAQPPQGILLKKQLLSLKRSGDSESTFLSCLEAERDLLVEYWVSVEGQEALRATLDTA